MILHRFELVLKENAAKSLFNYIKNIPKLELRPNSDTNVVFIYFILQMLIPFFLCCKIDYYVQFTYVLPHLLNILLLLYFIFRNNFSSISLNIRNVILSFLLLFYLVSTLCNGLIRSSLFDCIILLVQLLLFYTFDVCKVNLEILFKKLSFHFRWIVGLHLIVGILSYNSTETLFTDKIIGIFINPAIFSIYLTYFIPFLLINYDKRKNRKIFNIDILLIFLVGIISIYNGIRIAIILNLLILQTYMYIRHRYFLIKKKEIIAAVFVAVSVLCFSFKTVSTKGHFLIYKISLIAIKQNLIFGLGVNSFPAKYNEYQAKYFSVARPISEKLIADGYFYAHSELVEMVFEIGVIGFLIMGYIAYVLHRFYTDTNYKDNLATTFFRIILLPILFTYMFWYPFSQNEIYNLFFLFFLFFKSNYESKILKNIAIQKSQSYVIKIFLVIVTASVLIFSILYSSALFQWKKQGFLIKL